MSHLGTKHKGASRRGVPARSHRRCGHETERGDPHRPLRAGDAAALPSLHGYQRPWLRRDLVAGLTVWAVLAPEAPAHATIAGVSPVVDVTPHRAPLRTHPRRAAPTPRSGSDAAGPQRLAVIATAHARAGPGLPT